MANFTESAPWRGMQTVDAAMEPGYCTLALNEVYDNGVARCRPAARRLIAGTENPAGFYCYTHADGVRYFLTITMLAGTPTSNGSILFRVFRGNGASVLTQDLMPLGQPAVARKFTWSEMGDRVFFSNGMGPVFEWNPRLQMQATVVTAANGVFAASNKYLVNMPQPGHMANHRQLMVYAALGHESNAQVSSDVPIFQNYILRDVTAPKLYQSASVLSYNNHHVLFADMGAPNEITAASYIAIPDGEPVVATASLGRSLFIFSRHTINRISDLNVGADENIVIDVVSRTVGCPCPDTIVIAEDRILFKGDRGFYSLAEYGELTKISDALDRIFSRTWEPVVPRPLLAPLATLGAPWYPAANREADAAAVYIPSSGYYLCAVTTATPGAWNNQTIFACHLQTGAWSVLAGPRNPTGFLTPYQWGTFAAQPDSAYYLSAQGDVYQFGPWYARGYPDTNHSGTSVGKRYIHVSRPLGQGQEEHKQMEEVKLRVRGAGTQSVSLYVSGEETQYDLQTMADTELQAQSATVALHPEPTEGTAALFYWGHFNWGSAAPGNNVPWTPAGKVTIRHEANVVSRWFQYAWDESPTTTGSHVEVHGVRTKYEVIGDEP